MKGFLIFIGIVIGFGLCVPIAEQMGHPPLLGAGVDIVLGVIAGQVANHLSKLIVPMIVFAIIVAVIWAICLKVPEMVEKASAN